MRLVDHFADLISLVLHARQDPDLCAKLAGENLQKKFIDHVEHVRQQCLAEGYTEESFTDALFAVVALADESFLCSGSGLRDDWQHLYLQRALFDTSSAGDEFYRRLDSIDQDNKELVEVYLYSLGLGFKGRYFSAPDKINEIKQSYLNILTGQNKLDFPEKLFPDAYVHEPAHKSHVSAQKATRFALHMLACILPVLLVVGVAVLCSASLSLVLTNIFGANFH